MKFTSKFLTGICTLIVLCMGTSPSRAQSTPSLEPGNDADYKRLYYLNTQYIQSWIRSDTATYNRLLWAEDFVHQNSADGLLYPKKALLPLFGKPRFDNIEYFFTENVTVRFITADAAMIFAKTPFRAVSQETGSFSQYNDIYVRRNGKWVCVSANVTVITKPGDQPQSLTKVPAPPQLISHHPGTGADVAILKDLNAKRTDGFLHSKSELLESILADDFVLLAVNGLLYSKQEVIEHIKATGKSNTVDNISVENLIIRFVAPDVAMVHALSVVKLNDGRTTGTQYNDIYVKRGENWVCVSGNNTFVKY